MTGLEAINANNGWAMAAVGGSIVFSGLVVLSFTISQLHKLLALWDRKGALLEKFKSSKPEDTTAQQISDIQISADLQDTIRAFKLLTKRIGDPFALPKLLDLSVKCGLSKPHSTINRLVTSRIIVPDGKGYFTWNY